MKFVVRNRRKGNGYPPALNAPECDPIYLEDHTGMIFFQALAGRVEGLGRWSGLAQTGNVVTWWFCPHKPGRFRIDLVCEGERCVHELGGLDVEVGTKFHTNRVRIAQDGASTGSCCIEFSLKRYCLGEIDVTDGPQDFSLIVWQNARPDRVRILWLQLKRMASE